MLALNLPGFAPKVAEKDGKRMIFDSRTAKICGSHS